MNLTRPFFLPIWILLALAQAFQDPQNKTSGGTVSERALYLNELLKVIPEGNTVGQKMLMQQIRDWLTQEIDAAETLIDVGTVVSGWLPK